MAPLSRMTRSCLRKAVSHQQMSLWCQSVAMSFILQKTWGHSIQSGKRIFCVIWPKCTGDYFSFGVGTFFAPVACDYPSSSMPVKREIDYFVTMTLRWKTCQSKISNIILCSWSIKIHGQYCVKEFRLLCHKVVFATLAILAVIFSIRQQ